MTPELAKRVEEIALALGQVRSVVDTPGEIDAANKVYEIFSKMDYWKAHPENLYFVPVKNDPIGRKSCTAILEGKKNSSKKAVIMIGHIDHVGISDYGNLQEYSNSPFELMEKFKEIELTAIPRRFEFANPLVTDVMHDLRIESLQSQGFTPGTAQSGMGFASTTVLNTERLWQDKNGPQWGSGK